MVKDFITICWEKYDRCNECRKYDEEEIAIVTRDECIRMFAQDPQVKNLQQPMVSDKGERMPICEWYAKNTVTRDNKGY